MNKTRIHPVWFVFLGLMVASIFAFGQAAKLSPAPRPTPGLFVDATENLGVHFQQQASPTSKKYLLETMGSGVALFDYNNDGRLDIFFANGAPIGPGLIRIKPVVSEKLVALQRRMWPTIMPSNC